jgi:TrmH family RNA methyltransferase
VEVASVSAHESEQLGDTVTSQGILCVVRARDLSGIAVLAELAADACVVALDEVADPGNVGTIIRTCDWFGVGAVVLGGNSVELFNPKLLRSAMGSIFHLPVIHEPNFPAFLADAGQSGWQIWTTAANGGTLPPRGRERKIILFGNEARGVSAEIASLASTIITIPRRGKAESLNVAVSCGVVLGALHD